MAVISIHGDYANDEDMAVSYGQASGAVPTGYQPLLSTLKYLRRNSFGLKDIDQTETHWGKPIAAATRPIRRRTGSRGFKGNPLG
jgi:hypothetical protein